MSAPFGAVLALVALAVLPACDRPAGVPDRPPRERRWSPDDPETVPLPETHKRRIRDPRGAPVPLDAGVAVLLGDAAAPAGTSAAHGDAGAPLPAPEAVQCDSRAEPYPMHR